MPEISRFYGIVVFMNFSDHDPPHFHARYETQEVMVEIQTGMIKGSMSKRALRMLFEWAELHQGELMDNWFLARERKPLLEIQPLP
jgi:hypothetical protein